MKIAIYQGLPYHFEMIGYAIDYCISQGYEFTIYCSCNSSYEKSWMKLYGVLFGSLEWKQTRQFNHIPYDAIIMLTSDDAGYPQGLGHKTIIIDHIEGCKVHKSETRIRTRANARGIPWALPCFKATKVQYPAERTTLEVALVGLSNQLSEQELRKAFRNFDEIVFHVVSYRIAHAYRAPNIRTYENMSADSMFSVLSRCSYMIAPMASERHKIELISGANALAYTLGARLIMPASIKQHMGLKTAWSLEDMIDFTLKPLTQDDIHSIVAERDSLIKDRNTEFSKCVDKIIRHGSLIYHQ